MLVTHVAVKLADMCSVCKSNMWVNSKHFKRIRGHIMRIFRCFLDKNPAETQLCFQTKENRLTFPTREIAVLKCEDINVKYTSHLPCISSALL